MPLPRKESRIKPLILLAGYSAYPRKIDFSKMREIADSVGAVLMVDMAHFAGLVAGGVFNGVYNPVNYADVVTTTTHKTLRGPRGGMRALRCTSELEVLKRLPHRLYVLDGLLDLVALLPHVRLVLLHLFADLAPGGDVASPCHGQSSFG